MNFLTRWIVTAIAASIVIFLVPGIDLPEGNDMWIGILVFSLFLALINACLTPLLQVLSLPITILTLGLFALVVNTGMFYLAAWCCTNLFGVGVYISSFGAAFIASLLMTIVTFVLTHIAGLDD